MHFIVFGFLLLCVVSQVVRRKRARERETYTIASWCTSIQYTMWRKKTTSNSPWAEYQVGDEQASIWISKIYPTRSDQQTWMKIYPRQSTNKNGIKADRYRFSPPFSTRCGWNTRPYRSRSLTTTKNIFTRLMWSMPTFHCGLFLLLNTETTLHRHHNFHVSEEFNGNASANVGFFFFCSANLALCSARQCANCAKCAPQYLLLSKREYFNLCSEGWGENSFSFRVMANASPLLWWYISILSRWRHKGTL